MKADCVLSVILSVALLSSSLLVYVDPASAGTDSENTWRAAAPVPDAVVGGRAGVVDGKIYVIGGSSNYQYDPEMDKWTAKAPMPTSRMWFAMAVCQGKIYAIGGYDWNHGNPVSLDVNEVYDPSTDTWQSKQPLPEKREQLEAAAIGGQIYLIGGRGSPDPHASALNEVYDVANDSWTTKAPMLYPVASCSSAVSEGKIYAIGGQDDFLIGEINTNFVQIYDPSNNSWSLGASVPVTVMGTGAAAVSGEMAPRRIYLFGGYRSHLGDYAAENLVQVYDMKNNNWTFGKPMPTARCYLTVAVLKDRLYAFAGTPFLFPDPIYGAVQDRYNEVYTPFGYGSSDPVYVLEHSPPNVVLESSLNGTAITNSTVPLVFCVDKVVDWVGYSLDGQQNVTISGNFTLTGLSGGSHSVTVYVNDTYGNMGASEALTFSVELFPLAFIIIGALVAAVVGVVVGVVVFFKRRR